MRAGNIDLRSTLGTIINVETSDYAVVNPSNGELIELFEFLMFKISKRVKTCQIRQILKTRLNCIFKRRSEKVRIFLFSGPTFERLLPMAPLIFT